jgi:hypothetical protein
MVVAAALAVLAGACGDDDEDGVDAGAGDETEATGGAGEPSVTIASPKSGTTVKGNVVTLDLEARGLQIMKADGDKSGKTGHFHVFIDKDPVAAGEVIPREAAVVHTADDPVRITGLTKGDHTLTVVLGNGAHERIGDSKAELDVTVEGPTVDATAPAEATAGSAVAVEAKVEGIEIVAADADTSGKTGHLHLFVDREPTAAGQPIPKEANIIHTTEMRTEVPNLAPGEHTIWVVIGDGNHVPLDPPVMDKVTVTVK